MAANEIGTVKSGSGHPWQVKWDAVSHDVYVYSLGSFGSWGGGTHVGKASSAGEAMQKAEAFVYNK
ncbi:MAG: hypothetical protein PHX21_06440 [bacterium]|nr:hypothetical protein [bacterium]